MIWIKITDRLPDKDVTVLAWCNGEVVLARCYKDNMYNAETLSPISPQYWCEITPPKTKIQPQYPKSYEECCEILKTYCTMPSRPGYKEALIAKFQELLICRGAYWKIAGEQMGLEYDNRCFVIANIHGYIHTYEYHGDNNVVLAFSTEEMRDAFKENFKELIEECKEFS